MFFKKKKESVNISGSVIRININEIVNNVPLEILHVLSLNSAKPHITVLEDDNEIIKYSIEPLNSNSDLTGQFIHLSVRVLGNYALMIDGIISKEDTSVPDLNDVSTEAIRFQPIFLSIASTSNDIFKGKGLFDRGLHFSGIITPGNVRLSCVCDYCKNSFNLQSVHAGFSSGQYFYSTDSSRTLFVGNGLIDGMPSQLQEKIDQENLIQVESKLPKPDNGGGEFKYYNPLRCPHCNKEYIDFQKYPKMRPMEYYGNTFVNQKLQTVNSERE